jgi:hypothetical protein
MLERLGLRKQETNIIPVPARDLRIELLTKLARRFLKAASTVFAQHGIAARRPQLHLAARYVSLALYVPNTTQVEKALKLTRAIGIASGMGDGTKDPPVEAVIVGPYVTYNFNLPEVQPYKGQLITLWSTVTVMTPGLDGGVGLGIGAAPVYFEFSDEAPHAVVLGTTGSGKTELIRTILYQLMVGYEQADLRIAIADPKSDYLGFKDEEHLLWQPTGDFDAINRMIQYFHAEFRRREQHDLRNEPRWVLVLDEADQKGILGTKENRDLVHDISNRGRVFKTNLLIGSHMADMESLGPVIDGLNNRWFGMVPTAKLSGQVYGGLELHKLTGKGDFYAADRQKPYRFQVALTLPEHLRALCRVSNIPEVPLLLPNTANGAYIEPDRREVGRPLVAVDPISVAYYALHGVERVTIAEAAKLLGLSRTGHERNKEFTEKFLAAYQEWQEKSTLVIDNG